MKREIVHSGNSRLTWPLRGGAQLHRGSHSHREKTSALLWNHGYFLIFLTSFISGNVLPFLDGEITENRHKPGPWIILGPGLCLRGIGLMPVSLGLFAMVNCPHPYLAFILLEAWGGVFLTTNLTWSWLPNNHWVRLITSGLLSPVSLREWNKGICPRKD